jgi:hypothetical protein
MVGTVTHVVTGVNEVLAKVLLHNLACVVHAIEKYGIGVSFPLGKGTP